MGAEGFRQNPMGVGPFKWVESDLMEQVELICTRLGTGCYILSKPELQKLSDGTWEDIWGVFRKTVLIKEGDPDKGSYQHIVTNPLAKAETIKELDSHRWPSPDWYEYSGIHEEIKDYHGYAVVCGGDRLNRTAQFKAMIYLCGLTWPA